MPVVYARPYFFVDKSRRKTINYVLSCSVKTSCFPARTPAKASFLFLFSGFPSVGVKEPRRRALGSRFRCCWPLAQPRFSSACICVRLLSSVHHSVSTDTATGASARDSRRLGVRAFVHRSDLSANVLPGVLSLICWYCSRGDRRYWVECVDASGSGKPACLEWVCHVFNSLTWRDAPGDGGPRRCETPRGWLVSGLIRNKTYELEQKGVVFPASLS